MSLSGSTLPRRPSFLLVMVLCRLTCSAVPTSRAYAACLASWLPRDSAGRSRMSVMAPGRGLIDTCYQPCVRRQPSVASSGWRGWSAHTRRELLHPPTSVSVYRARSAWLGGAREIKILQPLDRRTGSPECAERNTSRRNGDQGVLSRGQMCRPGAGVSVAERGGSGGVTAHRVPLAGRGHDHTRTHGRL